ncbi:MAG: hypothetical protein ABIB79_03275 [archaeon]
MKRGLLILLFFLVICLILVNFLLILEHSKITGFGTESGIVSLTLEKNITILSPLNTTYNFDLGTSYNLSLNVSSNFNATSWTYTILDVFHNTIYNDSVSFNPNTTVFVKRRSNILNVSAVSVEDGESVTANVTFYINVSGSSPVLYGVNSTIYACEAGQLKYYFIASDVDEENLTLSIDPSSPFYLTPEKTNESENTTIELFSGGLTKAAAGGTNNGSKVYPRIISVSDGSSAVSNNTNITILEINNAPLMQTIGVQTVWAQGDNSNLYKEIQVTDVEEGNQESSDITFNISFSGDTLFNVSDTGIINYTYNASQNGMHSITVCAIDSGIDNPHSNLSVECGQDGGSLSDCETFSLTINNLNRAPNITNWYPSSLSLSVSGTDLLYFNVTEYDAEGTIPDARWYVGGSLAEYDNGSSVDEFSYSFGCGVSGTTNITVEITDGALNDSLVWNVSYSLVACPPPTPSPGGGGGVSAPSCLEKWGCDGWRICQNAEESLNKGILSGEDYRNVKEECGSMFLNEQTCGVQTKSCIDVNNCNTSYKKPREFQSCHYTLDPRCDDGIKNCHSGGCELLIDCGGPCSQCSTCSDEIENQNEGGVDCGGPCPKRCEEKAPILAPIGKFKPQYLLAIILTLTIIIVIIIMRIKKLRTRSFL